MSLTCSVAECDRDVRSMGWCRRHYQRNRRTGSPTGSVARSLETRFWAKVDKTDGCWLWTGSRDHKGYGRLNVDRKPVAAHRLLILLTTGEMPAAGQVVCHHCDTPACVRPDHLFVGTQSDNIRDMYAKGRRPTYRSAA